MAQAVISVLLQRPADARARPGDYFKDDARYESIFGNGVIPLPTYLTCVRLVIAVERFLRSRSTERGAVKNLKFYVAALVARELAGMAVPPPGKIISLGAVASVDEGVIEEAYRIARRYYDKLSAKTDSDVVARGTELMRRLNDSYKRRIKAKKAKT